jgi:hypothetical protein
MSIGEWRGAGGRSLSGGVGWGGRRRTAAMVGSLHTVRFLGSASLRVDTVGRLRASSSSEATGLEAAASCKAASVSLATRRSPQSSLHVSPVTCSPLIWSPAAAHHSLRRPRNPSELPKAGCSRLSHLPQIAPGSPWPTSPFLTIVLPMVCVRHRTLAPIHSHRPADAATANARETRQNSRR